MTTTDETLPLGLYEHLKSASLMSRAIPEGAQWQEEILEKDDYNIPELLTQFFATQLAPALESLKTPADQVELINRMMELLPQDAEEQNDSLLTDDDSNVIQMRELALTDAKTTRPDIPLSDVALMTNTSKDLNLNTEIQKELESADRVDLLCSFLKMSGVNSLSEQLKAIKNRGIPFRIITTTYMGATDRKAIDRLVEEYGAEVKISYQGDSTRLHAKAWLFHRNTGMSTGYVGSSNLSSAALTDGLEWNVRISSPITPGLIRQFEGLFESYWKSGDLPSIPLLTRRNRSSTPPWPRPILPAARARAWSTISTRPCWMCTRSRIRRVCSKKCRTLVLRDVTATSPWPQLAPARPYSLPWITGASASSPAKS